MCPAFFHGDGAEGLRPSATYHGEFVRLRGTFAACHYDLAGADGLDDFEL